MSTSLLQFVLLLTFSFIVKYAVTVNEEEFPSVNFCDFTDDANNDVREAARQAVIAACKTHNTVVAGRQVLFDGGCIPANVDFSQGLKEKKIGMCWNSNESTQSGRGFCITKNPSAVSETTKYLYWKLVKGENMSKCTTPSENLNQVYTIPPPPK